MTVFVVEQRAFGRLALVGSYGVQSLMDYAPPELGVGQEEGEEEPKPKGKSYERVMKVVFMVYSMGITKTGIFIW